MEAISGVFKAREDAEHAIKEVRAAGIAGRQSYFADAGHN